MTSSFLRRFVLLFALLITALIAGIVGIFYFWPAKWGSETTKNIVLVPNTIDGEIDTIFFIELSYKKSTIQLHSISAAELVEVPGGYGEYPLKSVWPLLTLDKKTAHEITLMYSYVLGIPVDEVWTAKENNILESVNQPKQFAKNVLWGRINTNLGLKDRVKFAQFFSQRQPSVTQFTSLKTWQEKQAQRLPDAWKDCRLTIVNTTSVVGLAGRVGNVLKRAGAIIVRLTDQTSAQPLSRFTIQPGVAGCQDLATHLTGLFPNTVEYREDTNIFSETRSEGEIVLGEDLEKFFNNDKKPNH